MNWGSPLWLWELAGVAVFALGLLLLALRKRGEVRWPRIARVVASRAGVKPVPAGRTVRRPWLLLLGSSGVIFALARPQWGRIEEPVYQQAREVMIALDLSRSMGVPDVPPTRLDRARLLVQSLLSSLQGERVGLIVFAGTAFVQVPLSADYQILQDFLPELQTGYMPQGGTDYGGMLRAALGGFSTESETDRYLIVLSDGESQTSDWRELGPQLRERGVRVLALGVGTAAGGFIPDGQNGYVKDERGAVVLSKLEPASLQELAVETRGVFRDASAWLDLPALLAETVERGRQGRFTEQRSLRHIDRFQWFLAPAVALALLGLWREIIVRPKQTEVRRAPFSSAPTSLPPDGTAVATSHLAVAGLLGVAALISPSSSRAADATPDTDSAAPVRESVARLVDTPAPTARDWRELAERTLVYGTGAKMNQETVVPGAIHDALTAVDRGEKADSRLTDWKKLRDDLTRLLEPPPEQPQQNPQDQPKQDEQQQEQSDEQQSPGGEPPPKNSDQSQQQPENQPQQNQSSQSSPSSSDSPGSPQSEPNTPPPSAQGEALGEMAQPPPPQPESAPANDPPQKTRKFGGRPATGTPPPAIDPQLAAALQRLRQATENDSPAQLFEALQGDEKTPPPRGRDW